MVKNLNPESVVFFHCEIASQKFEKKFLIHFKDDLRDGMFTEWYPSGKKKFTSHYKDGIENGFRKEWDEDGQLIFQGNFVDGVEEIK